MKIFYMTILFFSLAFANDANLTKKESSENKALGTLEQAQALTKDENKTEIKENKSAVKTKTLIDINTASKKELMTLNGITADRADAIIEYRKTHKFKSIDGIKNVPFYHYSIAEEFNKIKNDISVQEPQSIAIDKASNKTLEILKNSIEQAKIDVSKDFENQITKVMNSKVEADKNRVIPLNHGLNQAVKELQAHITKEPIKANESLVQPEIAANKTPENIKDSIVKAFDDIKGEFSKKLKASKSEDAGEIPMQYGEIPMQYNEIEKDQNIKVGLEKAKENVKDMNFTEANKEHNEKDMKEYLQDEDKELKTII